MIALAKAYVLGRHDFLPDTLSRGGDAGAIYLHRSGMAAVQDAKGGFNW